MTLSSFADELIKISAPAYLRAAEQLASPQKDWPKLEKELKNPHFRTEALKLVRQLDDPKLRKYLRLISAYNAEKSYVAKMPSHSRVGRLHTVKKLPNGRLGCSCEDWRYVRSILGKDCKHISEYKASLN